MSWLLRAGRRRHEVRARRDPRRGAGAARARARRRRRPVTSSPSSRRSAAGNGTLQTLLAGYTADAAVIAEPFGAAITTSQVGVLWFSVRITGVPGHAAEGRNATNAIEKSLSVIGALRELESEMNVAPPPPYDLFAHPINLNVGTIRGGDWPSTVPGVCVTDYRIALYPGRPRSPICRRGSRRSWPRRPPISPARPRCIYGGFALRGLRHRRRPPARSRRSPARSRVRRARRRPWSRPPAPPTRRVFGNVGGIPAVCFGPYAEQAHGVGERVYLPSVMQTAQVHGAVHPGLVRAVG